jgi:chromosome segregation ATPase
MLAKAALEDIDASSAQIAYEAERLEDMAKTQKDPQLHLDGLETIKREVNSIGSDLNSLEAERDSLAAWEVEALDRTTTLMHDVAARAEKAIATYNADRNHLWSTSYSADMAKAAEEAGQVKNLLSGYLKLAKVREQEDRLEHDLRVAPQN